MFSHGLVFCVLYFSVLSVCLLGFCLFVFFKIIFILRKIDFSVIVKAMKTMLVERAGL